MSIISLRLPDELETKLRREADLSQKARSEVARDAIAFYLERLERERFLARMESAARQLSADAAAVAESREMAESFLALDNEALALGERTFQYNIASKRKQPAKKRRR